MMESREQPFVDGPWALLIMIVLVAMVLAWPAVTAQEAVPQAPTLTETQRMHFQVLFLQRENAQLKFEAATAEIARLTIAVNVVPGYTFQLETLSFRPEPKKDSSP